MPIVGLGWPCVDLSNFALAHYALLEIGFVDGMRTNTLLAGKTRVFNYYYIEYNQFKVVYRLSNID